MLIVIYRLTITVFIVVNDWILITVDDGRQRSFQSLVNDQRSAETHELPQHGERPSVGLGDSSCRFGCHMVPPSW